MSLAPGPLRGPVLPRPCAGRPADRPDWRFDLQRFAGERTLPATPRRRQQARERGQVAISADLSGAAGFLAAAGVLAATAPRAAGALSGWAASLWGSVPAADLGVQGTVALLGGAARAAALAAGPMLLAAGAATAAVGAAQTGLSFSLQAAAPQFSRINPLQGLQRMFSRRALVQLGKAALRAAGILLAIWQPCRALLQQLVVAELAPAQAVVLTWDAAQTVLLRAGLVLLVAGAADFAYQRYENDVALRMTRDELRQESRETEGDPALRARRRRRQRELARRRMLADVRRADVVVANPTHFAVALRYDSRRMSAPQVVAKGADLMAERVKAVARAAGVMIVENPPLARSLFASVKVGQHIPAALYRAVAEVLAFVWRVRGKDV